MKEPGKKSGIFGKIVVLLIIAVFIFPVLDFVVFVVTYSICKLIGTNSAFALALTTTVVIRFIIITIDLVDDVFGFRKGSKRKLRLLRVRENCCPDCGYPRTGITSEFCPECGHLWTAGMASIQSAKSQARGIKNEAEGPAGS